jgi:hypothetical protein
VSPHLVELHPAVEAADRGQVPQRARPGTYWITDDFQVARVEEDGRLEVLVRSGTPWNRSIASVPGARRGP